MGFTYARVGILISGSNGPLAKELLVDTGALYTVISGELLRAQGLSPLRREDSVLADGSVIKRDMGEARVELEGKRQHVPVIFGEPNDPELLGVTALEIFGLEVDPISRRLKPARLIQYSVMRHETCNTGHAS